MKKHLHLVLSLVVLAAFAAAFLAASVPVFRPETFATLAGWLASYAILELAWMGAPRLQPAPIVQREYARSEPVLAVLSAGATGVRVDAGLPAARRRRNAPVAA